MSDSVRPHRRQPTRLSHPWDSLGKNTGVGCHFLLQCMKVKSQSEVVQSCPTLSNLVDCSLPGSSVHGVFQARVLEWGAIASIIILNVNGLNAPTKRHRLAEWIQKHDLYICCLQETHFRPENICRLKVRGWKNIFHANRKQKKAGVAILTSDEISSVKFSHSVTSSSLRPHESQPPCPSPTPGVHSNSCPLSR